MPCSLRREAMRISMEWSVAPSAWRSRTTGRRPFEAVGVTSIARTVLFSGQSEWIALGKVTRTAVLSSICSGGETLASNTTEGLMKTCGF